MANEKRLIDADALKAAIRDDANIDGRNYAMVKRHINEAKTADAFEVVRCAGCRHYDLEHGFCQFWHGARPGGHWCAEGERRK